METSRSPFFGNMSFPVIPQILNHGGDGASGWLQIPPASMPWGIPMANQPAVVRFTAEPTPVQNIIKTGAEVVKFGDFVHNKRKLEDDADGLRFTKQLITEEKMAARLSEMHISSNFTGHQTLPPASVSPDPKMGDFSGFKPKDEDGNLKRLVLSEEMKNIKSEPIIPPSILSKLEKPSMALVLWQPPSGSIFKHLRSDERFAPKAETSQSVSGMEEDEDSVQAVSAQLRPLDQTPLPANQPLFNNNTIALDLNSMDTGFSQACRAPSASMAAVDEMEC
ncbi:uncharacterized protein LOC124156519 isoform X2 [Ischnura elegans]|uniref:uncharacterized protein LOC124156519 isoform X2 n=1 Tax=Ischnura elegans TaxID=197161 RepID=UPI001ED88AAE|nr:uncharacterized protein LOC124156519 isoform X2 [Ischnura elegans]